MRRRREKPHFRFVNADGVAYEFYYKTLHHSHKADGMCWAPDTKHPRIYVDGKLLPRKKLAVIIEEMAHAFFFDKKEWQVRPFAATLAKLLYRDGWRFISEKDPLKCARKKD